MAVICAAETGSLYSALYSTEISAPSAWRRFSFAPQVALDLGQNHGPVADREVRLFIISVGLHCQVHARETTGTSPGVPCYRETKRSLSTIQTEISGLEAT
jgi:hypothetical protein